MIGLDLDKPVTDVELAEFRHRLNRGMSPNGGDLITGLRWIHIAVGRNELDLLKLLLEYDVEFCADRFGRWPSTIAAICEVSEEMCDLIVEAEARALGLA